jgi:hypothetical protein
VRKWRSCAAAATDVLATLEAQLRERIAFLRNLTPAASLTGLWKNHDSELLVEAADNGRYHATYGTASFGWAKYHCHFTAEFGPSSGSDKGLAAPAAHNTDPEVDEKTASTLFMNRSGATLMLSEQIPDNVGDAPCRAFARAAATSPIRSSHRLARRRGAPLETGGMNHGLISLG